MDILKMIDKYNISIEDKLTKKIEYLLYLDDGFWHKNEYNSRGNRIYSESSGGFWYKAEFNTEGNIIYYETSKGILRDDRKTKHINRKQIN